ncbi:hypothetical protein EJ04DRAFT_526210 [Polyplosphaeria fusca]|uniref:Uncharacterized protein n=1 Tax=Polyplosphaeria fusca TaxID=682080 RepID=A0A9P4QUW7_9PLEO|nr:hypothetical protein EJ04DRAFT_526210 [Polyplosphaeria fusca]
MSGSASTNATSAPQGLYPVVVFTTVYHLQFWGPRAPSPSAIATPYAGWYYMPIPYLSMAPPMAAYMPAAAPAAAAAQSANGASSGHEASSSSASQAPPGQDTTWYTVPYHEDE